MNEELDPIRELREDHKKVKDYLLELIDALNKKDVQRSLEILILLDKLGGPHFRFEEETLYPTLKKFFGEEYYRYLLKAHDRVITAAKKIAEVLGKGAITEDEVRMLISIVRSEVLPHPIECEGLALLMDRLSKEEIRAIAKSIERSRNENVPLLEWAETIRVKKV
ncbi:MAG: hemerythrin domain-containing protein [Nitrososphaerota archaeon]